MEVDAVTESPDHGHHSRHKVKACGCVTKLLERLHRRETERIEELSLEAQEQPQHLGDGEDHLAVRDIQHNLLPALGMTRWTKAVCLAGEKEAWAESPGCLIRR